jgi:DNA (cytosine-5)-methyltransferase 1
MTILNLYSGVGGNRAKWPSKFKVTAVELDPKIARVYHKIYPKDLIIVQDAHRYLEKYFNEFDIIWSSPPCQSHSQYRHNVGVLGKGFAPVMPDMTLYSEIVFLQQYHHHHWVVENVRPYYTPLIEPTAIIQRHYFWSSQMLSNVSVAQDMIRTKNKISDFDEAVSGIVKASNISNKRQVLRNCVDPDLGLSILKDLVR